MMKIGEVAREAGVSRHTIRHYIDLNLIQADRDPENGYQLFDSTALQRLRFIRTAQGLGLRLEDIQQIFEDADRAQSPCPRVRDLLRKRIEETRRKIAELETLCNRMEKAMADWERLHNGIPDGSSICRLIESEIRPAEV